jgi:acyl-CoA hydrolase
MLESLPSSSSSAEKRSVQERLQLRNQLQMRLAMKWKPEEAFSSNDERMMDWIDTNAKRFGDLFDQGEFQDIDVTRIQDADLQRIQDRLNQTN